MALSKIRNARVPLSPLSPALAAPGPTQSPQLELLTSLKRELQSKLHRSRSTHLVQGTQSAQATGQRSGGLAKLTTGREGRRRRVQRTVRGVNCAEAGMIEEVECFNPELQPKPFAYRNLASNREIHLPGTKATHKVPRRVPSATSRCTRKRIAPRRQCKCVGINRS